MFDETGYMAKLNLIADKKLMSKTELALEVGVSFNTVQRMLGIDKSRKLTFKSKRLLRDFVDDYEEKHGKL